MSFVSLTKPILQRILKLYYITLFFCNWFIHVYIYIYISNFFTQIHSLDFNIKYILKQINISHQILKAKLKTV